MSDVIGPSNKLPGQTIGWVPDSRECDDCSKLAEHAVIGETDSFGSEIHHLCNEHYLEMMKAIEEQKNSLRTCDICGVTKDDCLPFRDPAEGSCGPVYITCQECRTRINNDFIGDDEDLY